LPRHSTVLPRKRITDSFSEEGAGFSVSGFAIDLVCSGLKSDRDTLEKGFLPIPAFSSVAAVGRTAAKTWPSAGPGKN
jgi:hypothetical protein